MIETLVETITPDIAKQYLRHNTRNRTVKVREVESLAREITRGEYILTHQGIAFDESGTLVDGQNRLLAIIMSNMPIEIMVTRNLEPAAVMAIDRGISRSVRDVMVVGDYCTTEKMKALRDQNLLSAINQMVACNYKKMRITASDTLRLFDAFEPHIMNAYRLIISNNRGKRNNSQTISAAIAAMYCGVEADTVSKFFNVFLCDDLSGCGDLNVRAPLNWRRQIDDAKLKKVSIDRRKLYLGTQNAIWHFANNTETTRVVAPNSPRYDVEAAIKVALSIQQ